MPKEKEVANLNQFIAALLLCIQIQYRIIVCLLCIVLSKHSLRDIYDEPVKKPYRKLVVDSMPTIQVLDKLDYQKLILEHLKTTGKPLTPVSHRKPSKVPTTLTCPRCNAPHDYLYDNTGGRGQYLCKVCKCNFNQKNRYLKNVVYRCPHCGKALAEVKKRKDFLIYKCVNLKCSYYLNKLNSLSLEERTKFNNNPHEFKMHYIFRAFNFNFIPLANKSGPVPNVDLSKIYASPHLLGLVLSYHVNFGKSARETAAILREIHGVNISHQTVINYSHAVARVVKPFIDNFKYDLSDSICGDETYIKVQGKWHYVFFIFDARKKIILAYPVSPERDTFSAVKAIDEALSKFQTIPDNLTLIFDGNPIYLLAQHYFAQHDILFDVKQVIGLSNDDPVSQEYRPLKQIIERLNRTFKGNYAPTNGFFCLGGSVSFVTLFVAFFNFLRPHSSLERNVPYILPELNPLPDMPARWQKLIQLSLEFIRSHQSA